MPHTKPWFSFHLPNYTHPEATTAQLFDSVIEQARAAEDAGFAQVTVMDHLYQIPGVGAVVKERTERLDEALTIIRAMFSEERPSFAGRHYRTPDQIALVGDTLALLD